MPTITITTTTTAVNPGDLITAELMNEILQRLEALETRVAVPDVSKHDFKVASAMIKASGLQLGFVLLVDSDGKPTTVVSPGKPIDPAFNLTVMWQVPQANTLVAPDSVVHLVVPFSP